MSDLRNWVANYDLSPTQMKHTHNANNSTYGCVAQNEAHFWSFLMIMRTLFLNQTFILVLLFEMFPNYFRVWKSEGSNEITS